MKSFDYTTQVLVVGSGAAGLTGSLAAHAHGLNVLVIEKSGKIGGASAYSGGGIWIPVNPIQELVGVKDSFQEALLYLETIIKDVGPASSRERKVSFLTNGPEMVKFLQQQGFKFHRPPVPGYPDYYPDKPGGKAEGRCLEGKVFNSRRLGKWRKYLLSNPAMPSFPIYTDEAADFGVSTRTFKAFRTAAWVMLARTLGRRLLGQIPVTNGGSLIGQLLLMNLQRHIPIWRNSPLVDLIIENGRVIGAVVEHGGSRIRVRAERGVLLAAGGFSKNREMRETYHPLPTSTTWTSVPDGDLGDAIQIGMKAGAAVALMDDAWWGPTIFNPELGVPFFILWERALPKSIIVDRAGQRFMNEAESYVDAGHHQYERHQKMAAIPAWLVMDACHRARYPFSVTPQGSTPRSVLDSGYLVKADTLEGLALKIGVDPVGLRKTVERFNKMAKAGVDEDFGRGRTAYDRWYGDPTCKPNPNLGTLDKAPFYATKIWPGDLGTKGGLLTDQHARVMRDNGDCIPGLYAAGNTTASVMGRTYAGPGATIGPAMTFAYVAVKAMGDSALATGQARDCAKEPMNK